MNPKVPGLHSSLSPLLLHLVVPACREPPPVRLIQPGAPSPVEVWPAPLIAWTALNLWAKLRVREHHGGIILNKSRSYPSADFCRISSTAAPLTWRCEQPGWRVTRHRSRWGGFKWFKRRRRHRGATGAGKMCEAAPLCCLNLTHSHPSLFLHSSSRFLWTVRDDAVLMREGERRFGSSSFCRSSFPPSARALCFYWSVRSADRRKTSPSRRSTSSSRLMIFGRRQWHHCLFTPAKQVFLELLHVL